MMIQLPHLNPLSPTFKKRLKYQDDRESHIGTHGPDCWAWGPKHYDCALRHINSITDDGK